MKVLYIFPTVLLLVSCSGRQSSESSVSQPVLPIGNPLDFGLNDEEISAIEDHIQWAIDSSYVTGAVALIAKNDTIIYHKAFGHSDRARTKTMSTDNIFRLASMTKPITSTAIMQLVEQGKIALDDPVSKYIPEFSDMEVLDEVNEEDSSYTSVPADRDVTIHHLLTHTSGIAYAVFHPTAAIVYPQFDVTEAWTTDAITLENNIPKLGAAPLMHQPGEAWTYGTSIDVLGYIVEVASGMPFNTYLKENIFQPLDMQDIDFYLPDVSSDRLVEVWFTDDVDSTTRSELPVNYPVEGAKTYYAGGAGLVGTSLDYLKFASALLNEGALGDSRILQPSTVNLMMQNQIDTLRLGEGTAFGYGGLVLVEEDADGRNRGYWGWDGFWQTRFRIDPGNDMILILLTNAFTTPKWEDILGGYGKLVVQAIED